MIRYIENDKKIAVVSDCAIGSLNDILDIMGSVYFDACARMIIPKELFSDDFFSLRTGLAGEILQKFSNYRMKLVIVGDFDNVQSKSLAAFIYECNKGSQIFFKKSEQEAILILEKA